MFYNGTWGNVCENGVNTETASLIWPELNCGRTGTEYFGEARVKSAPDWLDDLSCRKHDSTLGHCPSSPWGKNRCDHVAQITCSEKKQDLVRQKDLTCYTLPHQRQCSNLTVTPTTAAAATATTTTTTRSKRRPSHPNRSLSAVSSTPPWVLLLLGTLLFLAIVLLVVLFFQNRLLRRGLSKRRRLTVPEAVYEEIDHRFITRRTRSSTKRGSLFPEEQNSGYEDVYEELPSEKSGIGEKAEDYDDVITNNELISDTEKVDTPEDYDDVITAEPIPDNLAEDEPENYDDVITADQRSEVMTEEIPEDYDDAVTMETNPNILTDQSEDYDDVISAEQDVGGAEDDDDVENSQTDSDHVTEKHRRVPFFRKLQFNIYNLKK